MESLWKPPVIGAFSIHLESVDSTNAYAQKLVAKSNPINGTVISTDFQTRGKGQRNHNWQSAAKMNLLLSIILFPAKLPAGYQFFLSMMTANAVYSLLGTILPIKKLRIKWPNDLYFGDKKIGGILIQNNLKGKMVESSIIGIGLNINQCEFDSSLPNPTSVFLESGKTYDLKALKDKLLLCLNTQVRELYAGNYGDIQSAYESRMYNRGVKSTFSCQGTTYNGIILGVKKDGRLVADVDGRILTLMH